MTSGKFPHQDPPRRLVVQVPTSILDQVEDKLKGGFLPIPFGKRGTLSIPLGARSTLVSELLREWLRKERL